MTRAAHKHNAFNQRDNCMVIRIGELSEILGITKKTIYNRLSANDDMPPVRKFGKKLLWLRKDVEQWLDKLPLVA